MTGSNNSIILQLTVTTDAPQLLNIFSDPAVTKFTNFKQLNDVDSLQSFLERFLIVGKGQPLQYGPYSILFNDEIVGLCGLQQRDINEGSVELWYILDKSHWGKGLAKQAVQQLLKLCEANSQLRSVYAEAVSTNKASWWILKKAGFIQTGNIKNGFKKDDIIEDLYTFNYTFQA